MNLQYGLVMITLNSLLFYCFVSVCSLSWTIFIVYAYYFNAVRYSAILLFRPPVCCNKLTNLITS